MDVGKNEVAVPATDLPGAVCPKPLLGRPMTAPSLRDVIAKITGMLAVAAAVKLGIEAAGHYP